MLVHTRKLRSSLIVTNNKAHLNKYLFRRALCSQNKVKKKSWKQGDRQLISLESSLMRILSDVK